MFGSGKRVEYVEARAAVPPQERHQQAILADFQTAVRTNSEAEATLRHAEQVAAQAALALVEARKRMRRVTDGLV